MNIRGIITTGFALLVTSTALAERIGIQKAWVRKFSGLSLQVFSDNIGHIAAAGREFGPDDTLTNAPVILLLNARGRAVAQASVPLPAYAGVVADQSGRIFFTLNDTEKLIHCVAFAPALERVLWVEQQSVSNLFTRDSLAYVTGTVANEEGGAYVFGSLAGGTRPGFYLARFGTNQSPILWMPVSWQSPGRYAAGVVRAPNGDVYGICNSTMLGKYTRPTILKYSPGSDGFSIWDRDIAPSSYGVQGAAFDAESNLILVGSYQTNAFYRSRLEGIVEKLGDNGWTTRYSSSNAAFNRVVVDSAGNIITAGNVSTVKYSSDGQKLWEFPDADGALHVDPSGNIFLLRQSERPNGKIAPELLKLGPEGGVVWKTFIHDGTRTDQYVTGLVFGEEDAIYISVVHAGKHTAIIKLVERRTGRQ